jgi:hypothetical protein
VVDGGLGVVGRGSGVQREAQGDGGAVAHEPGGRHDMRGVEMVQRAVLVPLAPAAPGGDGAEERAELAGADVDVHAPAAAVFRHGLLAGGGERLGHVLQRLALGAGQASAEQRHDALHQ